ncbi:MAG: TRAP transporter small permease subunit [Rhizobiaceae bacterium]
MLITIGITQTFEMITERIFVTLVRWAVLVCKSLMLVAFLAVITSAALRYFFSAGSVKLDDLQHYSFGSLILLSTLIAFCAGRHVKITLIEFPWMNKIFSVIWMLVLVCVPMVLIVLLSVPEVRLSWLNLEGSAEPGGLGGVFLLKTLLPVCALLFVFVALHKVRSLMGKNA